MTDLYFAIPGVIAIGGAICLVLDYFAPSTAHDKAFKRRLKGMSDD